MFGFFKFLNELFGGTYFTHDVNGREFTSEYNPSVDPRAGSPNPPLSDGSSSGFGAIFNPQNWKNTVDGVLNDKDFLSSDSDKSIAERSGLDKFFSSFSDLIPALVNRITAGELTGAEREQNAFNAQQAEIDRQFQADMSNTQYQRGVADMRAAGVNPAMAIGNGGAAAPSGSTASGSGSGAYLEGMSALMSMMMIKPQIELMRKQGDAAIENAAANKISAQAAVDNAETAKGNLGVNQYNAETNRLLANNTIRLGDNTIRFTDAQIESIAQSIEESKSRINLQGLEASLKELDIEFSKDTLETRKELLLQELVYKAVQMSNIQAQTSLYYKEGKLLDNEAISQVWKEKYPKLASTLDAAGVTTGVLGNILRGSISGVLGKWSK